MASNAGSAPQRRRIASAFVLSVVKPPEIAWHLRQLFRGYSFNGGTLPRQIQIFRGAVERIRGS